MPSPRIRVRPKQSLGQNFLVDDNIARKIVRSLHPREGETIIEIGPGQGALTRHLSDCPGRIIAVEIDSRMIEGLKVAVNPAKVEIINQNFLELDLASVAGEFHSKVRLIGNIPYHLTSPILFKAFGEHGSVSDMTIMVQREVARRITASPGSKEYGILSVFSHFYGTPKLLFTVSPNCFYPKPKVTSAVIRINFKPPTATDLDTGLFHQVVKSVFGKRRKTLRNGLRFLNLNKEVSEIIQGDQDPLYGRRPEQLSLEEFVELTRHIQHLLKKYQVK